MSAFSELLGQISGDAVSHLDVTDAWLQGRTAYGGLTAALCVEAAIRRTPDLAPLRSAQFAFVGPATGRLEIRPETLRSGKSATFVSVDVAGEAGPAARALLMFGAGRPSELGMTDLPRAAPPRPEACEPYFRPGSGPGFAGQYETRLAAGTRPFTGGAPEMQVWIRHRDPHAHRTPSGLVALADAIPPAAIIAMTRPAPFSTSTWTLDFAVGAVSASGWWLVGTRTDFAGEGYSGQHMAVWTDAGEPVIAARQSVALFG